MGATKVDRAWAEHLMAEHCRDNNIRRSGPGEFSKKDATAVLARITRGGIADATPGLVQALYDSGADVSFERRKSNNWMKVIAGRDQMDVRSRFLEDGVLHCSDGVVYLLALRADQDSLDRALPGAIAQNSLNKVSILLARGANATPLCAEFLAAVASGSDGVVDILLGMHKGACQDCRNQGLVKASASGQLAKVVILLDKGASAAFGNVAALKAAIRSRREDVAMAIVSRQELRSHVGLLDSAVEEAYASGQHRVLKACLEAGARGPATDAALLKSVEHGHLELVEALVAHGASVEHQAGAPVHAAIRSGQPRLLRAVLRGKPSEKTMMAAVETLVLLKDLTTVSQMADPLVASGLVVGDGVSKVLSYALDETVLVGDLNARLSLVSLVVRNGRADVNSQTGSPVVRAAAKGWPDILALLLSCRPSLGSLQAALAPVMELSDPVLRLRMFKLLMGAAVDRSDEERMSLEATAVTIAAKCLRLDILEHVTSGTGISQHVALTGFCAATSVAQWFAPLGLSVVRLLLHHGASGAQVDDAFCYAARTYQRDAFELLAPYVNPSIFGQALGEVVECSEDWLAADNRNLWVVHSLFELGAKGGEHANRAFVRAVDAYLAGVTSEALVKTMLCVGAADVGFQSGIVPKMAIRAGNVSFFQMLISQGADRVCLSQAFHEAVSAPLDEGTALSLLDVLELGNSVVPDFKATIPNLASPIRECLAAHPESAKLVRRLHDLGCDLDAREPALLYRGCGLEPCSPLLWALGPRVQGKPIISSAAIEALVKAKVDVKVSTPVSKTTPLILAANNGRTDIVTRLIKAGADTRQRDCLDSSALFYASCGGHLDTVKVLLKFPFKPNDGSLHEAARNLFSEVTDALIKSGKHSANYHSSHQEHDGRTPLQEMAYRCDASTWNKVETEDTLAALERGKVQVLDKWQGKNALFLALENRHNPYAITRALLDNIMWRSINDDDNVYEHTVVNPKTNTRIRYYFSPTMYICLRPQPCPQSKETAQLNFDLKHLLKTKSCADRFYAEFGAPQPPGAINIPADIAKEAKRQADETEKRLKREREHREELSRQEEANMQKLRWEQSRHEVRRQQEAEKLMSEVQRTQVVHETKLQQDVEMRAQQLQALARKNAEIEQARLRAAQTKAQQVEWEQAMLVRKHQVNLGFQQASGQQKVSERERLQRLAEADERRKLAYEQASGNQKVAERERLQRLADVQERKKLEYQRRMQDQKVAGQRKMGNVAMEEQRKKLALQRQIQDQKVAGQRKLGNVAMEEDRRKLIYQQESGEQKVALQKRLAKVRHDS
jgi:ankyrin repeat protein